jgi:hypothetical protein
VAPTDSRIAAELPKQTVKRGWPSLARPRDLSVTNANVSPEMRDFALSTRGSLSPIGYMRTQYYGMLPSAFRILPLLAEELSTRLRRQFARLSATVQLWLALMLCVCTVTKWRERVDCLPA